MMIGTVNLAAIAEAAERQFEQSFGRPAQYIVAAPGRVNVIGEHTDYNEGFVLPMAIDRYVVIAAGDMAGASLEGTTARVFSTATRQEATITIAESQTSAPAWARYVFGVMAETAQAGLRYGPFEAVIDSNLPLWAGLSSSAALEVAVAPP